MSYTPPKTRTKDDANKELKEIELKINVEKSKLEVIQREREEAEAGFAAREKKVKDSEEAHARFKAAFDAVEGESDAYRKKLNDEIHDKNKEIARLTESIQTIEDSKLSAKEDREKEIELLNAEIDSLKNNIRNLSNEQNEKKAENEAVEKESKLLAQENAAERAEKTRLSLLLDDREQKLKEAEIKLEQTKSDLRVWAVRLFNKYKSVMTENEILLFPGDKE